MSTTREGKARGEGNFSPPKVASLLGHGTALQITMEHVEQFPIVEKPASRIVAARYVDGWVEVELDGVGEAQVRFRPSDVAGLRNVPEASLSGMRITASGQAVLLESGEGEFTMRSIAHVLGIQTAKDSQLRAAKATSPKKAASSAANGKKGGRPRKAQPLAA